MNYQGLLCTKIRASEITCETWLRRVGREPGNRGGPIGQRSGGGGILQDLGKSHVATVTRKQFPQCSKMQSFHLTWVRDRSLHPWRSISRRQHIVGAPGSLSMKPCCRCLLLRFEIDLTCVKAIARTWVLLHMAPNSRA